MRADRARPGHRRALRPHRGAAVRRRQGRARRHRRAARARPGRGGDHRPLRRLDCSPTRAPAATLDVAEVERVARWATGDLRPHLTVVLDLEPEHGLGRFEERDRIEGESLEFHQRVRAGLPRPAPRPTPTTTSCSTPGCRSTRSRPRSATGSSPLLAQARAMTSVWDGLVGQRPAIAALQTAAGGHGMSHAWLFTGPPGSGRSNAADRLRGGAAVRGRPAAARCHACHTVLAGTHADVVRRPHREAVDRRRRGARPGPALRARPGRPALADPDRRGRRPAHRAGLQRAAQGDRGAHRPHGLDALRAHRRGRAADDPLPLPAGHADRRPPPPTSPRSSSARDGVDRGARVVRRPRQPGPHRPRPGAGPRRGDPQPSPRGGRRSRPG